MWVLVIMWSSLGQAREDLQFETFRTEAQCLAASEQISIVAESEGRVKTVCVGPEGVSRR